MFQLIDSRNNLILGEAETLDSACQMLMHFQQNMSGVDILIVEVAPAESNTKLRVIQMLTLGINQARTLIIPYLEWTLRTRIPNPRFITAAKLPEWSEQLWLPPGWRMVRLKRVLAAITNKGVLIGDFSLEDLHQDLITNWLIPHELLHLVNLSDKEIEALLLDANQRLGRTDVVEFIRSHSGYLEN